MRLHVIHLTNYKNTLIVQSVLRYAFIAIIKHIQSITLISTRCHYQHMWPNAKSESQIFYKVQTQTNHDSDDPPRFNLVASYMANALKQKLRCYAFVILDQHHPYLSPLLHVICKTACSIIEEKCSHHFIIQMPHIPLGIQLDRQLRSYMYCL